MRGLLEELSVKQDKPTVIVEDNKSCLDFVVLDQLKRRSKHIATRYHYTRKQCAAGVIKLQFCTSEETARIGKAEEVCNRDEIRSSPGLIREVECWHPVNNRIPAGKESPSIARLT